MRGSLLLLNLALGLGLSSPSYAFQLKFIGSTSIPTGTMYQNTEVGGLSGITYNPVRDEFFCISDEKIEPRFYRFKGSISGRGISMTPIGVTFLRDGYGRPPEKDTLDTEGIALMKSGDIVISSEGNGHTKPKVPPTVMRFSSDGRLRGSLPIPDQFLPEQNGQPSKGIRDNRGFESLSITPDESFILTGSEDALKQDDNAATFSRGSNARLLRFDLAHKTTQQFVYHVEAVPHVPADISHAKTAAGLSDVLSFDATHFLALERAVMKTKEDRVTWKARIYAVSLDGATDVSSFSSLREATFTPVQKRLLLDLDSINPSGLDNMEGLSFGPVVDGHRTLVLVSDNNFAKEQRTLFLAFEIIE